MTTINRANGTTASGVQLISRHPQRISITISWALQQHLIQRSDYEGRSLSNLAAHILETSCRAAG
jgi:hypothetical protein